MNTVWWWGVQLKLRHDDVNVVAGGGTAAAALLAGVTWWIAALILAVAGWIKAADKGNGVYFYVTWAGVWWIGSI